MRYPTENGIAVPPWGLSLPESEYGDKAKYKNNHHAHFPAKRFGSLAVTSTLRDLERHQYDLSVDVHSYLHATYKPPEMPTEEQAAKEIINAYEQDERLKIYDYSTKRYFKHQIPIDIVDSLVAKYGLIRVFDMAAD